MQERDPFDNTTATQMVDFADKVRAVKQIQEALDRSDHIAIGQLPDKGTIFTLNGLHFIVKFVDYKRGEMRVKLFTPKKTF